jgi:hypothetical protein
MHLVVLVALAALALSQPVQAQSSYAGMQDRSIKALSDSQVADLEAGRGMGLALAAELNGYPGPSHVLSLPTSSSCLRSKRTASSSSSIP